MIDLNEIAVFPEIVKLELFLRGRHRKEVVAMSDPVGSEDKLVVFEQIVSMLIHIHLE